MTSKPTAEDARQVIRAVNSGSPPPGDLVSFLTVGNEDLIERFVADLDDAKKGEYRALALLGNPGSGKSHNLNVLRREALSRNFVVSQFSQDTASQCSLNRPDQVYSAIIESLTMPAPKTSPESPFRVILSTWAQAVVDAIGGPIKSLAYLGKACDAGFITVPFLEIPKRTRLCLIGLLLATRSGDEELRLMFLNGMLNCSSENGLLIDTIRSKGVEFYKFWPGWTPNKYNDDYYMGQLRTLADISTKTGLSGLAILCDEVTGIADLQNITSRKRAYSLISNVLTNTYGFGPCYFVMSFLPAFIMQLSADVRRQREWEHAASSVANLWSQYALELQALSAAELVELAGRVRDLYAVGFPAEPAPGFADTEIAQQAVDYDGSIRDWVKYWAGRCAS